eukprot:2315580-Rhodomonas_salina.1
MRRQAETAAADATGTTVTDSHDVQIQRRWMTFAEQMAHSMWTKKCIIIQYAAILHETLTI